MTEFIKGDLIMYPQTAREALDFCKSHPECDYVDFSIQGDRPHLKAKTRDGQWIVVWDEDMLDHSPDHPDQL
jgi:hypothetical protein